MVEKVRLFQQVVNVSTTFFLRNSESISHLKSRCCIFFPHSPLSFLQPKMFFLLLFWSKLYSAQGKHLRPLSLALRGPDAHSGPSACILTIPCIESPMNLAFLVAD